MKAKRVHCENCKNFTFPEFYKKINYIKPANCKLKKRVMFRRPVLSGLGYNFGYIRYCNDFKIKRISVLKNYTERIITWIFKD